MTDEIDQWMRAARTAARIKVLTDALADAWRHHDPDGLLLNALLGEIAPSPICTRCARYLRAMGEPTPDPSPASDQSPSRQHPDEPAMREPQP